MYGPVAGDAVGSINSMSMLGSLVDDPAGAMTVPPPLFTQLLSLGSQ
jgi:hypothetical protein